MRTIVLAALMTLAASSNAAVIFSDNFDSNCTGAACFSAGGTSSYPTTWDQWYNDDGGPVTVGGETHYSGEITSPGRGSTGKSLKIWRYNGYFGNYSGALFKIIPAGHSSMWFRYYIRIPSAFQFLGSSGYKQWRFNVSGGGGELYLNVLCPTGDCATNQTWGLYDNSTWTTVLSDSDYDALRDGNWHAVQWSINLSTGAVALYVDGVSKWSGTKSNIGGTFTYLQHFAIGNSNDSHTWISQSSWQAAEYDDLVMATTKAETDPIGGGGTAPTAAFTCAPLILQAPGSTNCTDQSAGSPASWAWTCGNGTTCVTQNCTCTYSVGGSNTVSLTATNAYGSSTETKTGYISARYLKPSGFTASGGASTATTVLFSETFENTSFAARGWYDITTGTLDSAERFSGTYSLRCDYALGGNTCTAPKRRKFTETDNVYISYRVKYSSNFVGSGVGYHPHEFYLLTNLNGDYDGLAFDYLTLYLESHWNGSSSGVMRVAFQDGQNVDQARIGQNLIGVTENRATAGCNGSPAGYSGGCYDRGDGIYVNAVTFDTSAVFTTGNKNAWNLVKAYYKLNTVVGGIGLANGIIRIWFNDVLVFERTDALLRTGQRSTMMLNQLVFSPWIGDGSPVAQSMWIDDLVIERDN